jgi:copper chaperone
MSSPSPAPSPAGHESADEPVTGGLVTIELAVEGMHCESCVLLIQEVLAERSGVSSSSLDLDSALATVAYDPSRLGPDDLRSAIEEAGYTATPAG